MSDRPKTMAERTADAVARIGASAAAEADEAHGAAEADEARGAASIDPSTLWTGTPLKKALENAQAAGRAPAGEGRPAAGEGAGGRAPASERGPAAGEGVPAGEGAAGGTPSGENANAGRRGTGRAKPTSSAVKAKHAFAAGRSVARKLALQALYRWLLNEAPWQDLVSEFREAEDMANADRDYFRELVEGVWGTRAPLDTRLGELIDRPVEQLDPVEHAVLLIGLFELTTRTEIPYRVVINESVGLAKRFGATDGHKFVNAVLDRAARVLRPGEK